MVSLGPSPSLTYLQFTNEYAGMEAVLVPPTWEGILLGKN